MNLHITPSFNIDRLCKTASVLLFLVIQMNFTSFEIIKFVLEDHQWWNVLTWHFLNAIKITVK